MLKNILIRMIDCKILLFLLVSNIFALEVPDIINKIQSNIDQIQDMKISVTTTIDNSKGQDAFKENIEYIMKKPDKVKIVDLMLKKSFLMMAENNPVPFVQERQTTPQSQHISIWPEPGIIFYVKDYLSEFDVIISSTNMDSEKYVLIGTPYKTNNAFPKMEWTIEYSKGIVTEIKIYTQSGKLMRLLQIPEYQLVNEKIWFPKKVIDKLIAKRNTTITTILYDNVQINTGIPESVFSE
ncbi:MAG: outer membrane lipoprotein-sorting protein [Elusimicrobia bacterium]|nr:outer membrane lipoprotein-sorting protein [Elusimicrobiota bacterium]